MKNPLRPANSSRTPQFEAGLKAYSQVGKAVAALGAAVSAGAMAQAQTIVNLTSSSFTGTPTSTGGTVYGSATAPGPNDAGYHSQLKAVGFAPFGGSFVFRASQSNYTSGGQRVAQGNARMTFAGVPLGVAATGGLHAINFVNGAAVNGTALAGDNWTNARAFNTYGTGPASAPFNVGQKQAGNFNLNSAGYLGFRVRKSAGHYYFGWLKVMVGGNGDGRPVSISLVDNGSGVYGAYNSTLDGSINVGQLAAIPEPSTVAAGLGLFALGAAGVREHRRRRQAAA